MAGERNVFSDEGSETVSKHTPGEIYIRNGLILSVDGKCFLSPIERPWEELKANEAELVCRWNAFPKLLEMCEEIHEVISRIGSYSEGRFYYNGRAASELELIMKKVEAVIENTKGES